MNIIRKLLGSNKFRVALAAVVVWAVSMVGWNTTPGPIEAFLATVAVWLGAAGALVEAARNKALGELREERREHALGLRAANETLAKPLPGVVVADVVLSRATTEQLAAEMVRRGALRLS